MTDPWRLAPALLTLRAQVNALAPNRSKASDGTIGDERHAARKSAHNPNEHGVVCALDLTHDPRGGLDCQRLVDALVASKDTRLQLIIWNRRILSSTVEPWVWRPYNGSNPHDKHCHIEVLDDPTKYENDRTWTLLMLGSAPIPVPIARPPVATKGDDIGAGSVAAGIPATVAAAAAYGAMGWLGVLLIFVLFGLGVYLLVRWRKSRGKHLIPVARALGAQGTPIADILLRRRPFLRRVWDAFMSPGAYQPAVPERVRADGTVTPAQPELVVPVGLLRSKTNWAAINTGFFALADALNWNLGFTSADVEGFWNVAQGAWIALAGLFHTGSWMPVAGPTIGAPK